MTNYEAEKFYKKNNCSTFNMANDNLTEYYEFLKLKINSNLLKKWQEEHLVELLENIKKTGEILTFISLSDFVENHLTIEYIDVFITSLDYIDLKIKEEYLLNRKLTYTPEKRACCIAEQIIGGKSISTRSGILFHSYDIGALSQYELLKEKTFKFLDFNSEDEEIVKRRNYAVQKLKEIIATIES